MRFLRSRHISTRIRLATESLNPAKPRSWSLSTAEESGMMHASLRAVLHRTYGPSAPPSNMPKQATQHRDRTAVFWLKA